MSQAYRIESLEKSAQYITAEEAEAAAEAPVYKKLNFKRPHCFY